MSELIIVCGLMGSGKTTFAREYAKLKGYEYIDFDQEYHGKIKEKKAFLNWLIDKFNSNKEKNFVIDNWFKWKIDWYECKEDKSIEILREKMIGRRISFIYLFVPFGRALKQYLQKHKEAHSEIIPEYPETMNQRQENLLQKILRCLNG